MPNDPVEFSTRAISPGESTPSGTGTRYPNTSTVPFPRLGELSITEGGPVYFSWGCQAEYAWDLGLRCAPLALPKDSPNKKVAFWRVHAGVCGMIVSWIAQSFSEKPVLPSAQVNDANLVLVSKRIAAPSPARGPDGTPLYTVCGAYAYALQQYPADQDALGFPASPLANVSPSLHTLTAADFRQLFYLPPVSGSGGLSVVSY
jgi:hypothetical protein